MIIRTLWTNVAIQGVTFVASVVTARLLGPVGRGELALVLLYPQLVAHLALFGADRAVAVLGGRGQLATPLGTICRVTLLLSLPAMAAGYAVVLWRIEDPRLAQLAIIYLTYIPAGHFFALASFFLNGVGDFPRFNWSRLGFYSANLCLLVVVSIFQVVERLEWVVFANLAAMYVSFAWTAWQTKTFRRGSGARSTVGGDLHGVLSVAATFLFPVTLVHLSSFAHQIVLEHRAGVEPLGLFVVFYSFSRLISPLGSAISSHVFQLGISGVAETLASIFRRSFVAYVCCAIALWIIAPWVVPLVYGDRFEVDPAVVGLLIMSSVFSMLATSVADFMNGRRKAGADAGALLLYLTSVAVLGWVFVPQFGLTGMAAGVAVADFARCVYLVKRASIETGQSSLVFWRLAPADLMGLVRSARDAHFKWWT